MKKIIQEKTVYFCDDLDNVIMYIDHSTDECIWGFYTENIITISHDMELYDLIHNFMSQYYEFDVAILQNYKDKDKLTWYSDCYYNPSDEWSIASISCLNIERNVNGFKIWCTKELDKIIKRPNKSYGICFSPAGNGVYSKNIDTGSTLQDDFVMYIYQPLLFKNKVLKIKSD